MKPTNETTQENEDMRFDEQGVRIMDSQLEVEPLNLDEKIAAILLEDIHATSDGRLVARQHELYSDDNDSWADVKTSSDLLYVAQGLIKMIMDWHTPPAENDTPDETA